MSIDFTAVAFFACAAYAVKALAEVLVRRQWLKAHSSMTTLETLVESDKQRRQASALFWGIILICLAVAFGLTSSFDWKDFNAAVAATFLGLTGLGNLIFVWLYRRKH